jgi:hypothetical protein
LKPHRILLIMATLTACLLIAGCITPAGTGMPAVTTPSLQTSAAPDGLTLVAKDGNAAMYRTGNITVLRLEGTYRDMGRQYGRLMKKDIVAMYDTVRASIGRKGFVIGLDTEDQLLAYTMRQYERYPQQYKEIVEGISETSGVPVSHIAAIDLLIQNYVNYPSTELTPDERKRLQGKTTDFVLGNVTGAGTDHCSSITVWSNYTGQGPLVMGRNFDFSSLYRNFNPYRTVVVYHPTDGSVPTAVLGWSGSVGGAEAFNREGLVMETDSNPLVPSPNNEVHITRIPTNILVLKLVMDSPTIEQFDAAMETTRFGFPLLSNVATPDEGYTYEIGTRDVVRRGDTNYGLAVVTNIPLSPGWKGLGTLTDKESGNSVTRRNNLLALGEKYRGTLNATVMEKIMDTRYGDGGATFETAPGSDSVTVYQFVYVPGTRTLSLKAPTYDDWTTVNLKPLF